MKKRKDTLRKVDEMKGNSKLWKALMALCLAGAGVLTGYFIGDYAHGGETVKTVVMQQTPAVVEEKTKVKYSDVIAIVNLDEGIVQGDTTLNYGNTLISATAANIRVTGLQDARNGIETGQYCAYLVIPTTFSENVMTINEKPVTSELTYAIASGLEGEERDVAIYDIYSIYNSFSNNISQIYTATILDEYHDAQDAAQTIMAHDTKDMNSLMDIQTYNLVEMVPAPELEKVENEITKLVLEENYAANTEKVNQIDTAYKSYLTNGEEGFLNIRNRVLGASTKSEDVWTELDKANQNLKTYITETEMKKDQLILGDEEEIAGYQDKLKELSSGIEEYNQMLEEFNDSVEEKTEKYQFIENEYRNLVTVLNEAAGVQGTVTMNSEEESTDVIQYTYEFYTAKQLEEYKDKEIKAAYENVVAEMTKLNNKVISNGGKSVLKKNQTMEDYVAQIMGIDTGSGDKEETTGATPEETTGSTPEETTGSTPEETTGSTPEETTGSTPEETTGATPEETIGGTPEETTGATPEEITGGAPEETTGATPEETTGATPEETTGSTPEGTTGSTPEGTTGGTPEEPADPPVEPDVPDDDIDDEITPITFTVRVFDREVGTPSVEIDGTAYTRMQVLDEEAAGEKLNDLIAMATDSSEAKSKKILSSINQNEEMQKQLEITVDTYNEMRQEQLELDNKIQEYNLLSYVNDSEINGIVSSMNSNMNDIENKVRTHDLECDTYTKTVYQTTEKNITTLKENIAEAQKLSELKVSEGLENAKTSRAASNEENISLLKTLTSRLLYTRLGTVENREVYAFMANPVTLDNRSEAISSNNQQAVTTQTTTVTTTVKEEKKSDITVLLWIIPGVFGLLVIAGIVSAALYLKRKRTTDEF